MRAHARGVCVSVDVGMGAQRLIAVCFCNYAGALEFDNLGGSDLLVLTLQFLAMKGLDIGIANAKLIARSSICMCTAPNCVQVLSANLTMSKFDGGILFQNPRDLRRPMQVYWVAEGTRGAC